MYHRQKGTSKPLTEQKTKTDYPKFVLEKVIPFYLKRNISNLMVSAKTGFKIIIEILQKNAKL